MLKIPYKIYGGSYILIKYIINIGKYNMHTTNLNNYVLKY